MCDQKDERVCCYGRKTRREAEIFDLNRIGDHTWGSGQYKVRWAEESRQAVRGMTRLRALLEAHQMGHDLCSERRAPVIRFAGPFAKVLLCLACFSLVRVSVASESLVAFVHFAIFERMDSAMPAIAPRLFRWGF